MSEIPEDLLKIAGGITRDLPARVTDTNRHFAARVIALALLARDERAKAFWQQWAAKRLEINRSQWLRAAKRALDGDMRDLRLRVELAEAPPVEIVLSAALNEEG